MAVFSAQFWLRLLDQVTAAVSVLAAAVVLESGLALLCLWSERHQTGPLWGLLPREASVALTCGYFASFFAGLLGLSLATIRALRGDSVPEANWLAARAAIYACGIGGTLTFAASLAAR